MDFQYHGTFEIMKLKIYAKEFNKYTQIDKFALIPKKMWNDVETGSQQVCINGQEVRVRIYDVPCDCNGKMHSHRLIDLRDVWDKLGLRSNKNIEISGYNSKLVTKPDI